MMSLTSHARTSLLEVLEHQFTSEHLFVSLKRKKSSRMLILISRFALEHRYSVTGLPGPADHCKPGEPYSTFDGNVWTHVGGPGKPNCGDLIFSGHMLQVLNFTLAMHHHRHKYFEKAFVRIGVIWFLWLTVVVQAICIIMARNHYTVDVVAACYVTPMLWYTLQNIYESPTFKRLFPSYMGNFKYDYATCSSDCEDIPIVKCMTRLGSFISRRLGFSVRVSFSVFRIQ